MKTAALSALLLLAPSLPVMAQQLTPQETAFLDSCSENASRKIFSPVKAGECLDALTADNYRLLNKAKRKHDVAAAALMSQLESVKDLDEVFKAAESSYTLRSALKVRMEKARPCVLCGLGLGPQPEKLYTWVSRYAAGRLQETKQAGLDWTAIDPAAAAFLSARSGVRESWADQTITGREKLLSAWASAELDKVLPDGATRFDYDKHIGTLNKIWPYLSDEEREKVITALRGAAADAAEAQKKGETTGKKFEAETRRIGEMQSALAGLSGADAAGFLNRSFDNNTASGGAAYGDRGGTGPTGRVKAAGGGTPAGPQTLTDEQAKALSPRLLTALTGPRGELSDTPIGRDAIAFMKTPGGKLDFAVERLDSSNTRGVFYPGKNTVRLNSSDVEAAMRKANVTTAELMDKNNKEAVAKVARYVAPVFVHEYEGHQKQTDWANRKKIPDLYYIGQETEAFSKGALFVLQKTQAEQRKGNSKYSEQISESDVHMARLLRAEGTAGVGRHVMYYNVNSQRGKAAENFGQYEALKKELALRAQAARKDPAAEAKLDKARPEGYRTEDLKFRFRTVYSWYREAAKKSGEENKYFQNALNALDGGKN